MRRSLCIVLALSTAPGFAGLSPRQGLVFTPEEGLELTETYEQEYSLELVDMSFVVVADGREEEQEVGEIEIEITSLDHVEFTDQYVAVDGGRPAKVRRTYDALSSESSESYSSEDGDSESSEKEGASALEGLSVVFTWDDDAEEYDAEYDGEEADEDLLAELEVESVLARFLPDDEVEKGDSWEVDVEAFNVLSSPGGYLAILDEDEEENRDFSKQLEENLEGEIEATFQGLREVDGEELAVVHVTTELESEVTEEQDLEREDGVEGTVTRTYTFGFVLEGDLLWDMANGLPRSFLLEGDATVTIVAHQKLSSPVGELELVQTQELEGDITYTVSVE